MPLALAFVLVAPSVRAGEPPSPEAAPATPAEAAAPAAPAAPAAVGDAKAAEQHFARARQLYDEGDFALSLIEFQRAYDLSPNYRVLYNIGQVDIQLFNYAAARVALEKYLEDGGSELSASRRAQAEADVKMLRTRTAYLSVVSVPPGAEVSIDDVPVGKTPFAEPRLVNAGRRKIVVTRPGSVAATRLVTLAGGDRNDLRFELTPVPVETVKSVIVLPRTSVQKNYTPATIGWVATGVFTISAAIVGGLYLSKQSEIDRLSKPETSVTQQAANDAGSSATRLAVAADILGLAAIGAGAVAVYFTLRPPRTETTTPTPKSAKLRVTPTLGGLAGSF